MIGQDRTKYAVLDFINSNSSTLILCGEKGSGKKTLAREVVTGTSTIETYCILPDNSKESIKIMSDEIFKINTSLAVYVIPDVDEASVAAMNSLLKITEEPPNNSKIILTCTDLEAILPTIRSRAQVCRMQPYTSDELSLYYWTLGGDDKLTNLVLAICNVPGDINTIIAYDIQEFYDYTKLVFNNIEKVSLTNALKIGSKIAFKEDSDGYDLKLFFRLFSHLCFTVWRNSLDKKSMDGMYITGLWLQDLRVKGINKSALFDTWVIEIRKAWSEYEKNW